MREPHTGAIWLLLDAAGMGGIERHVMILCRALIDSGRRAEIVLMADHGRTQFLQMIEAEGLPHRVLPGAPFALARALREARPCLVHTHGYKAGIIGRIASRLCAIACVSTFHAGERAPFPVGLYQRLDEALAFLARPISVSREIAQRLPWASTVVANFVPAPPRPCSGALPRNIVFVGRLSAEKGPDIFCEIAERNAAQARFHVYGDGPLRAQLEARYGGIVRFHGHVADVAAVWREAGLLMVTSRAEGLPMACLEAMSHGVPVAAANVGALAQVVQHGRAGWLFEACDVEAASDVIAAWASLAPHEHEQLRQACRARVADQFGVETGLAATLRVYAQATGAAAPIPSPLASGA
jgi:glycosyltransferase involved in cell wall biosynthesis